MKKIIAIVTCLTCIFCSPQIKLNKNRDVDIVINVPLKLNSENSLSYVLKNNTENTIIIDPYGFTGNSYWSFNNEKLIPINFSKGYYSRDNDDCKNDLIILEPKQKIETYLNLNYHQKEIYDFSKSGNYIWSVESNHNKQNGMPSSCKQYINFLEKKGYIFLDDKIDAKIPFVRE